MSLIVLPEDDRLCVDEEADEGWRRLEDTRRRADGLEGVSELARGGFVGDLLLLCRGVDERRSGFSGREFGSLWVAVCDFADDTSRRTLGVTEGDLTGDDGGRGVEEGLFIEACVRVAPRSDLLSVVAKFAGVSGSVSCSIDGSGSSGSMVGPENVYSVQTKRLKEVNKEMK
jgi:hypothetical protein